MKMVYQNAPRACQKVKAAKKRLRGLLGENSKLNPCERRGLKVLMSVKTVEIKFRDFDKPLVSVERH